ncbi:MAG: ABC-F family ATP-binding cassette domain-containing protein [cyanobacterium endosymbiont of Rhopalodia musculus]|uniref:ABC-F family ATP-binding cassette domain-containing protein n=1 Tax=cyanobacterium endosymbiont of Epithemia clementina EcSB TaxID=3034674 RepID=UPI0024815E35|nr:ABC-F family ATP-binding cassette domain-containing protein [cyanobacterium endosymbiont of Epithemia clementina EcSB]WGT67329.1 ABC-F family ATP-binding cassette domain-containing protein [cyanobacterium endosymbiont of Epithemia clementina EcSB]
MLRLENISKIYPTAEVLKNVTWEINPGERIGLVGANGAGKSTQLKIIMGQVEPTSGEVVRPGNLKIGYLTQEFEVEPTRTVHEEFWTAFEQANRVYQELTRVQHQMEVADSDKLDDLIHKLDELQREFEALDGYSLDAAIAKILPEMGFELEDSERLVSSFSCGWQMRMSLGKILLQDPDILLLDEPTNHLDLETIEWVERYLKGLNLPMVVVSHEREFLDRLCTKIVETERGISSTYVGNYSNYLQQKNSSREIQENTYQRQQKERQKQQEFVDRFRASATRSTQAKSRERQLEKMEVVDAPIANIKTLQFEFPPAPTSGREVVIIKNLVHGYENEILFLEASLSVERGDRIAVLGPNGAGKSTLLRLIMNLEKADGGEVNLGKHNVIPGYFEQNQAEALDLTKTVMNTIHDEVPDWTNTKIRSLLGRFLFSGETVFKKVEGLSGGEKARLALLKMLLKPANLLILDEPTNHLDIPAKEMLEEALSKYDGTVLCVSHDRYFISQVANKIVEIKEGELIVYPGDYHFYLDKKEEERQKVEKEKIETEKEAKAAEKRAKQKKKVKAKKAKT